MIIQENSKIIQLKPREIKKEEVYLPQKFKTMRQSIFEDNGKHYYAKILDTKKTITELLGSSLAKLIQLNAVDYKIGKYKNDFFVLSEVFFNPDFDYTYSYDFYGTDATNMYLRNSLIFERYYLSFCKMFKKIDNSLMLENILKLIALDLKMGQTDRNDHNLILQTSKDNNITNLAPIFDFAEAYEDKPTLSEKYFYENAFVILRKNFLSLYMFCLKNPKILEYLNILCDTPIVGVLEELEKKLNIIFNDYEKKYYEEKDKEYTKILKRII